MKSINQSINQWSEVKWSGKCMARVSTLVALLAALMELDNSLNSALTVCDATLFPNVRSILHIFPHFPWPHVQLGSHVLRLIKTYIRSTVDNDCLNDLALFSICNTTKWLRKLEYASTFSTRVRLSDWLTGVSIAGFELDRNAPERRYGSFF